MRTPARPQRQQLERRQGGTVPAGFSSSTATERIPVEQIGIASRPLTPRFATASDRRAKTAGTDRRAPSKRSSLPGGPNSRASFRPACGSDKHRVAVGSAHLERAILPGIQIRTTTSRSATEVTAQRLDRFELMRRRRNRG